MRSGSITSISGRTGRLRHHHRRHAAELRGGGGRGAARAVRSGLDHALRAERLSPDAGGDRNATGGDHRRATQRAERGGLQRGRLPLWPGLVGGGGDRRERTDAGTARRLRRGPLRRGDGEVGARARGLAGGVGISPPNLLAPGQPLATARQTDNQIDVFFVDGNGVINVMWVVDGGGWSGPVGLTPPGTAIPRSWLGTARQTANQIDLFFIDGQGMVNVMWVVDGGAWQGPVGLTGAGAVPRLAARHRAADRRSDRPLLRRRQRRRQRDVGRRWRRLAGSGRPDRRAGGARRGARSRPRGRASSQIDLFFVDRNGVVNVMWVVGGGAWAGSGRAHAGKARRSPAGSSPPGDRPRSRSICSSSTGAGWST